MDLSLIRVAIAACFFALLIHVLGALLGAKLAGFQTFAVQFGPIYVVRHPTYGWQQRLLPISRAGDANVYCYPLQPSGNPSRLIWKFVTGSAANIVAAGLGLTAMTIIGSRDAFVEPLLFFSILNLALGTAALLPGRISIRPVTNGDRLRRLAKSPACARQLWAVSVASSYLLRGIRPREWPKMIIADALGVDDMSVEAAEGLRTAYNIALDSGDLTEAKKLLSRLQATLATLPARRRKLFRHDIDHEAAFIAALDGDVVLAQKILAGSQGCGLFCFQRARAEAAVLVCEGEVAAAQRRVADVLKLDLAPFTREWLERTADGTWRDQRESSPDSF